MLNLKTVSEILPPGYHYGLPFMHRTLETTGSFTYNICISKPSFLFYTFIHSFACLEAGAHGPPASTSQVLDWL